VDHVVSHLQRGMRAAIRRRTPFNLPSRPTAIQVVVSEMDLGAHDSSAPRADKMLAISRARHCFKSSIADFGGDSAEDWASTSVGASPTLRMDSHVFTRFCECWEQFLTNDPHHELTSRTPPFIFAKYERTRGKCTSGICTTDLMSVFPNHEGRMKRRH
jgi:hypothetical protein